MRALFVALVAWAAWIGGAAAQPSRPAIESFASDPIFLSAHLSPDGQYVIAIRAGPEGDDLIRYDWRAGQVAVVQRVRRGDRENQIDWVDWKSNDMLIMSVSALVYTRASRGNASRLRQGEDSEFRMTRILSMDLSSGRTTVMFEGETRGVGWGGALLVDSLPYEPDFVLLAAYGRTGLGLWRTNVRTGATDRIENADWDSDGWATDGRGNPVIRRDALPNNTGWRIHRRAPGERRWTVFTEVRSGERVNSPDWDIVGPGPEAGQIWVLARPEGEDTSGLYLFDTATGVYGDVQFELDGADFEGSIWLSPQRDRLLAACASRQRRECRYFDEDVARHINAIDAYFERAANVTLIDMSDDGNSWLIRVRGPTVAPGYHIYDRANRSVIPVAGAQPNLEDSHLSPMAVMTYSSRDGSELWGYLTAPASAPPTGAPLVVFPHGGPESRDFYDYDASVQFFASRGYLVFQPQFRGSGGFGNAFADAGRRQWGLRMQHDVTDGVQHLIQSGRVDPNRICIVGHSYGGYAALAGATLTPDLYRCAASINGVSDLSAMLRTERADGGRRSIGLDYWRRSIGDPSADRAAIEAASPRRLASAVRIPVLLISGEDDRTVPVEQSRMMRDALTQAGRTVRYVEIPEAGHSWYGWELEQRVQMFTELESFLAQHLAQ